ncbi:MAG: FecR domain-containing protein [Bryobacteraceae bacterium]
MSERERAEFGRKMLEHLPLAKAPDSIWPSIEAALEQNRLPVSPRVPRWRWAFAALAAMALLALVYWRVAHRTQWIETDAHSRVTVKVGEIGTVEVEPGTRLRVVTERPNEHRFALAHGEIRAKISAPPKLFFVDTAVGTAIDLGCEYTLSDDELGRGLLTVTRGWVSFQWKGLESLVPAGASCRTHPRIGPGIPYFDDAPQNLKGAVENFSLDKDRHDALNVILAVARVRDTLTLWHLLQRVDVPDRARVYDRIASLTPVPSSVSRDRALLLDPETLKLWKDELAWKW